LRRGRERPKLWVVTLLFQKYEGLGNDFLVVAAGSRAERFDAARARALCDRHRGVGADGVLSVGRDADGLFMRVVNADGSRPEMCGNGIRCAMLYLARAGEVGTETVQIDTDAGPHACTLLSIDAERRTARIRVAMRPYSLAPDPSWLAASSERVEAEIAVDDRSLRGTAVSMGNPHLVIFDAERQGAPALAPRLERHPLFPARVNVGLAEQTGPRAIGLRVFERGVGLTEACGTGACAAAAAAVETGRMPRGEAIEVSLPGGVLTIVVADRGAPVSMTGPARFVFQGDAG
jgi:diaminopimelate epimerase